MGKDQLWLASVTSHRPGQMDLVLPEPHTVSWRPGAGLTLEQEQHTELRGEGVEYMGSCLAWL